MALTATTLYLGIYVSGAVRGSGVGYNGKALSEAPQCADSNTPSLLPHTSYIVLLHRIEV